MSHLKKQREKINDMKRIFDHYGIERLNIEDDFFMELLNVIESKGISKEHAVDMEIAKKEPQDIQDVKLEYMVNIEGILNEMKGKTKRDRFSFGVDVLKLGLKVFLAEAKLLIADQKLRKNEIIVFYDDSLTRLGNRGLAITQHEIITNINGGFKIFTFMELDQEIEFVKGHKKDAIRLHLKDSTFDIKVAKSPHFDRVKDIMNLLYKYGRILVEEFEKKDKLTRI